MNGFKDLAINQIVADAIINDIKEKVMLCCDMMEKDLSKAGKKINNNELVIRDYLLEGYLQNNAIRRQLKMLEFLFQPEVREKASSTVSNKYGNVDIKILIRKLSFDDTKAYFIIECKRIDGTITLNGKYVADGVCRFVSKNSYYSTYKNNNFMLGFVIKNIDINNNAKIISNIQDYQKDISVYQPFSRQSQNTFVYSSKYYHKFKIVELIHIFYDFSRVVS